MAAGIAIRSPSRAGRCRFPACDGPGGADRGCGLREVVPFVRLIDHDSARRATTSPYGGWPSQDRHRRLSLEWEDGGRWI